MAQSKGQLTLGYWAIRGLAEPSRLLLHYTKTPYNDEFYVQGDAPEYSRDEWLSKKSKLGLDFPNLPYLFDGDIKLTQSKTILCYLARKYHLMGKNEREEALISMIIDQSHDLRIELNGVCYHPKEDFATDKQQFIETKLAEQLKLFDDFLKKTGKKWSCSDDITAADFQLFEYIDSCLMLDESIIDKYSHLKKFMKHFREIPELENYLKQVHAQLPLNNKVAKFGGTVIPRNKA